MNFLNFITIDMFIQRQLPIQESVLIICLSNLAFITGTSI
jgi:hypothetical protein